MFINFISKQLSNFAAAYENLLSFSQFVDFKISEDDWPGYVLRNLCFELSRHEMNKWKKVVILIDECDSPINNVKSEDEKTEIHEILMSFFRLIKSLDEYLSFCFVSL